MAAGAARAAAAARAATAAGVPAVLGFDPEAGPSLVTAGSAAAAAAAVSAGCCGAPDAARPGKPGEAACRITGRTAPAAACGGRGMRRSVRRRLNDP